MSWINDHQQWREDLVNERPQRGKKKRINPQHDTTHTSFLHSQRVLKERELITDYQLQEAKKPETKWRRKERFKNVRNTVLSAALALTTAVSVIPPVRYQVYDTLETQAYRILDIPNAYQHITVVDGNGQQIPPNVVENRLERRFRWYQTDVRFNDTSPLAVLTVLDEAMSRRIPQQIEFSQNDDGQHQVSYSIAEQRLNIEDTVFPFFVRYEQDNNDSMATFHAVSHGFQQEYTEPSSSQDDRFTIAYTDLESFFTTLLPDPREQEEDTSVSEDYFQLSLERLANNRLQPVSQSDDGTFGHIRVISDQGEPIPISKLEERIETYFEQKDTELTVQNNSPIYLLDLLNDSILRAPENPSENQSFSDLVDSQYLFYSQHLESDGIHKYNLTVLPYNADRTYQEQQDGFEPPTYTLSFSNLISLYETLIEKAHDPSPREVPIYKAALREDGNTDTITFRLFDEFPTDGTVDQENNPFIHEDYIAEMLNLHNQIYSGLASINGHYRTYQDE